MVIVSASNKELVVIAPSHSPGTVPVKVVSGATLSAGDYTYETAGSDDLERVMLPVVIGGPGAFGSVWVANVTAFARTDDSIALRMRDCSSGCTESVMLSANTMTKLNPVPNVGSQAAFVYVPHALSDKVDFSLRVQDTSRQSQTWGTELPVVFAHDFTDTIWLHDVPVGSGFRSALRVYGYTALAQIFTVNVFDESGTGFLDSRTETTVPASSSGADEEPLSPSSRTYASLAEAFPSLAGHDRVQIQITSQAGALVNPPPLPTPIWAFVSVTNNETQHVTTVTPHHAP